MGYNHEEIKLERVTVSCDVPDCANTMVLERHDGEDYYITDDHLNLHGWRRMIAAHLSGLPYAAEDQVEGVTLCPSHARGMLETHGIHQAVLIVADEA